MPVATIFKNIEAAANIDEITQWYDGVTRRQVLAVVELVTSSLDKPRLTVAFSNHQRPLKRK